MPCPSYAPYAQSLTQGEVMLIHTYSLARESCKGSKLYGLTSTKLGMIAAHEYKAGTQDKSGFISYLKPRVLSGTFLDVPCLNAERSMLTS
jgi:hypothetical protein